MMETVVFTRSDVYPAFDDMVALRLEPYPHDEKDIPYPDPYYDTFELTGTPTYVMIDSDGRTLIKSDVTIGAKPIIEFIEKGMKAFKKKK